ncbi:tRNA (guanosine(46)-N7)-methyltransferase TrmB [Negadavirga shengliensis]|uniref:tRNA (guanine-N(7)-)-methyltransferase n=1 Tax=Negadavirga shengliensis TaxID=1389218 RepID=A0ABV9T022_9BACT
MGRKKLERFKQNEANPIVVQPGKPVFETVKGNWNKIQFEKDLPLVVELACGRGEFTVGLAREYPRNNFIGVDIKGSRIWKGSTIASESGLTNVAFLRTQIELLSDAFEEGEISEIWITFPDPRPKDRDEKRRLTSPKFLEMFKKLLVKRGVIHLKTDNTGLYEYTQMVLCARQDVKVLKDTSDFYRSPWKDDHHGIMTRYEKMFMEKGESIKYLQFMFT